MSPSFNDDLVFELALAKTSSSNEMQADRGAHGRKGFRLKAGGVWRGGGRNGNGFFLVSLLKETLALAH